jgi:hypothetical protein
MLVQPLLDSAYMGLHSSDFLGQKVKFPLKGADIGL